MTSARFDPAATALDGAGRCARTAGPAAATTGPPECNCCPSGDDLRRVTSEDAAHAQVAAENVDDDGSGDWSSRLYQTALATAFRPGGLVARTVIAELERACERIVADCSHGDSLMGEWPAPKCPFCQPKANSVAALADEWRDGKR